MSMSISVIVNMPQQGQNLASSLCQHAKSKMQVQRCSKRHIRLACMPYRSVLTSEASLSSFLQAGRRAATSSTSSAGSFTWTVDTSAVYALFV